MNSFFKNIWRKIRVWLIGILSKGLDEEENESQRKKAVKDFKEKFTQPGLDCPKCGILIPMDIFMLLSSEPIVCPNCNLKLEVNKKESEETLSVLNNIQQTSKDLEKNKTFTK